MTKAVVILDGTLLPIDRIAADRPFHSGKHKKHGMNVQVITDPFARLLWASAALPGAVHELKAARTHGILARGSASGQTSLDIFELSDGNYAVIGTEATAELEAELPVDASRADHERIVLISRETLIRARKDIPLN